MRSCHAAWLSKTLYEKVRDKHGSERSEKYRDEDLTVHELLLSVDQLSAVCAWSTARPNMRQRSLRQS